MPLRNLLRQRRGVSMITKAERFNIEADISVMHELLKGIEDPEHCRVINAQIARLKLLLK